MTPFYSYTVAIFELDGDNNAAQAWVLSKLEPLGDVRDINITRWVEPYKNEPVVVTREVGDLSKYTLNVRLNLEAEGYADAQAKIVGALTEDANAHYVNIQSVNLTKA